jgi:membrane fusion protein (multidrug efflux system)
VTAYQPVSLATIQQLDPIYVDVPQSTTDMLSLKRRLKDGRLKKNGPGSDKVKLIQEDGAIYSLEGALQFSDITVDQTTGSVILRVVFPNPEDILLPGMFVQAVIKEGINEQAILIPQQGVSRDSKGNPFALIVDAESKAAFRPLTIDRAIGDKWLVSAGLVPGDPVIVEGLMMLRPGATVKATPFKESQADEPSAGSDAQSQKRSKGGV